MARRARAGLPWLLSSLLLAACGRAAPFPPDVETAWAEPRSPCRLSHDHDLQYVRRFVSESALPAYLSFDAPYPVGAVLVNAEYGDETCTLLQGFASMEKLEPGSSPDTHDWRFARFRPNGQLEDDPLVPERCVDCHSSVTHCGELPFGWDLTCGPELPPARP